MWGIIPAAGAGSRIQPLAFSKELLPVGLHLHDDGREGPRAVSEFLVERMIAGGATKICFVISPGKTDILEYYCCRDWGVEIAFVVQPTPAGLCDALFRAAPVVGDEDVLIGLPDTIWTPQDAYCTLPAGTLSFLLFHVEQPQFFDAVKLDEMGNVLEIQVKQPAPETKWVWGAIRMPGKTFHDLRALWREPERGDEYIGTLVNAWLARGGSAVGMRTGETYVDVGTLDGYREALRSLTQRPLSVTPEQLEEKSA